MKPVFRETRSTPCEFCSGKFVPFIPKIFGQNEGYIRGSLVSLTLGFSASESETAVVSARQFAAPALSGPVQRYLGLLPSEVGPIGLGRSDDRERRESIVELLLQPPSRPVCVRLPLSERRTAEDDDTELTDRRARSR
jgi:hypothetical protein